MNNLNLPVLSELPEIERLAENHGVSVDYFDHLDIPVEIGSVAELKSYLHPTPDNYVDSYEPSINEDNIYILLERNDDVEELLLVVPRTVFIAWWKTV